MVVRLAPRPKMLQHHKNGTSVMLLYQESNNFGLFRPKNIGG